MLAFGQLSRTGQVLLLGLCGGDPVLTESTRAAIMGDIPARQAAADAGMAESTFRGHVNTVKATLARVLGHGAVKAEELVETDDVNYDRETRAG